MTSERENEFRDLVLQKVRLFEIIFECAKRQSALNCAETLTEYKNLLERRARCIDEISKTEIRINHFLASNRNILSDDPDLQIEMANEKIKRIIERILEIDEGNKLRVSNEMQAVKDKIELIRKSRTGISGYASLNKLTPSGAYTDSRK